MKMLYVRVLTQILVVEAEAEEEARGYITEWSYHGSSKVLQEATVSDRIDRAKIELEPK
jgi:hypothetical protein